jgi:hypothetical protein
MRWRRRTRRTLKWTLSVGAVVFSLAWIASVCGWAQWLSYMTGEYRAFFVGRGFVRAEWSHQRWPSYARNGWIPHNPREGWTRGWYSAQQPLQGAWLWMPYGCAEGKNVNGVVVLPLWCPVLVMGVPAWLAWRRDVRDRNWCYWCDYERRGLAEAAVCPECGKGQRVSRLFCWGDRSG